MGNIERKSDEYHTAHLSFARAAIVEAAALGQPILDRLRDYTADVVKAERDRNQGAVSALQTAIELLDDARPDFTDPTLRRRWAQRRKALRARAGGQ